MQSGYKIQDGETIFDVILNTYGKLDLTYKLLLENNSSIDSIDQDLTEIPGTTFLFDDELTVAEEQLTTTVPEPIQEDEYMIQEGQSLYDLALILYGNVEYAMKIVRENQMLIPSINNNTLAGIRLKHKIGEEEDQVLTDYLKKNDLVINTSDPKINPGNGFSSGFNMQALY